ncbi:MAG: hypothetical protein COB53_04970 [Elusimicrobia bacterium]|nr:MAG: hypothetical protein COB53_04970 [Elusimicrobiota bacterium]
MYWIRKFALRTLDISSMLFSKALIAVIGLFFISAGIALIPKVDSYAPLVKIMAWDAALRAPLMQWMHTNLPINFKGFDAAPWLFITLLFILLVAVEFYRDRNFEQREILRFNRKDQLDKRAADKRKKEQEKSRKTEIARLEKEAALHEEERRKLDKEQAALYQAQQDAIAAAQRASAEKAAQERADKAAAEAEQEEVAAKIKAVEAKKKEAPTINKREELMELLAQTKKSLDEQKRFCAFLAMDVVNSTGMKQGEDPAIAARDFKQYKKHVMTALQEHKFLKLAWTPDGQMICFDSVEDAIRAGQAVLSGLDSFNKDIKAMKMDFRIRAGINAGRVLYDDETPMEEMSDRVIDIAGHMQKYAPADSIFISSEAVGDKGPAFNFSPDEKVVDGSKVLVWRAHAAAA